VALAVGIVVACMRPAVALGDAQVGEQERDRLGGEGCARAFIQLGVLLKETAEQVTYRLGQLGGRLVDLGGRRERSLPLPISSSTSSSAWWSTVPCCRAVVTTAVKLASAPDTPSWDSTDVAVGRGPVAEGALVALAAAGEQHRQQPAKPIQVRTGSHRPPRACSATDRRRCPAPSQCRPGRRRRRARAR
jgi:hypothetical protein